MTGMGKNIGTIIDKISGSEGRNVIQRVTKNPALEAFNLGSQKDYSTTKAQSEAGLDEYIKNFLAGTPAATANAAQETGAVNRYYNGDVERALAGLRTQHAAASDEALQRALGYATHAQNLDRISGGGGDSSYNRQLALKTGADLSLNTLLQNLAQQRADEEYVRQNQLGLAGRRTAMADALAGRALVPGAARKAELGWSLGTIGNLLQNDQANNIYGLKYKPSAGEQFSQWQANDANDIKEIASIASSVYGGGGGGGAAAPQSTTPVSGVSWAPSGAPYTPPASVGGGWSLPSAGTMTGAYPAPYTLPPMGSMYPSIATGGWGASPTYSPAWN